MAKGPRESLIYSAEWAAQQAQMNVMEGLGAPRYRRGGYQFRDGWTCPQCGQTCKWNTDDEMEGELEPCSCGKAAYQPAYDDYLRQNWAKAAAEEWAANGIPPRYSESTFANFRVRPGTEGAVRQALQYAQAFERGKTSDGLFFTGLFGTGKTHLAVAAARLITERTLTRVVFKSTLGLMMEVKAGFGRRRGDDDEPDPIAMARDAELLIIDDLGQEVETSFNRETIAGIIWHRYDHNLPTIFTSNQADDQLKLRMGEGFVSRLYHEWEPIFIEASDYRKEIAAARK